MADGMTLAAMSMINDMNRLSLIGQNVTNSISAGYKRELVSQNSFSSLLLDSRGMGTSVPVPGLSTTVDMRPGTLRPTGNKLDLAIEGPGFFEVTDMAGTYYTRQGAFALDASGRLVTPAGEVVSGVSGDIRLSSPFPRIDQQGRVYDGDKQVGQLKVVMVDDARLMSKAGQSHFSLGKAEIEMRDGVVRQGYTEASNVDTGAEMVKLIETVRHFESAQKVIQIYDEMTERAISKLGEF